MDMELRMQLVDLETNEDGTMMVSGYVNKTGKRSNVLGTAKKFVEKILPGAFTRAISNSTRDIDFLSEHDSKKILASTRNDSLILTEDDKGLYMRATIAPTSWGKDTYTLIQSGILKNMSFGFRAIKDSWRGVSPDLYERVIEELELFEVSVVRDPAYSQSTIAARGIDLIEDVEIPAELEKENRDMEQLQELVKSLEERVGTLVEEVKELRSVQEKALEVREHEIEEETRAKKDEKADEKPSEKDEKSSKEDEKSSEKEEKADEKPAEKEEKAEDESEKDEKPSEKDSESSEDKADEKKEKDKKDEEKEQKRSKSKPLSEFRSRLASLK